MSEYDRLFQVLGVNTSDIDSLRGDVGIEPFILTSIFQDVIYPEVNSIFKYFTILFDNVGPPDFTNI